MPRLEANNADRNTFRFAQLVEVETTMLRLTTPAFSWTKARRLPVRDVAGALASRDQTVGSPRTRLVLPVATMNC